MSLTANAISQNLAGDEAEADIEPFLIWRDGAVSMSYKGAL
ncbi:MAG: hypothetical protein ABGZ53_12235 [Fuerstiella sp.]